MFNSKVLLSAGSVMALAAATMSVAVARYCTDEHLPARYLDISLLEIDVSDRKSPEAIRSAWIHHDRRVFVFWARPGSRTGEGIEFEVSYLLAPGTKWHSLARWRPGVREMEHAWLVVKGGAVYVHVKGVEWAREPDRPETEGEGPGGAERPKRGAQARNLVWRIDQGSGSPEIVWSTTAQIPYESRIELAERRLLLVGRAGQLGPRGIRRGSEWRAKPWIEVWDAEGAVARRAPCDKQAFLPDAPAKYFEVTPRQTGKDAVMVWWAESNLVRDSDDYRAKNSICFVHTGLELRGIRRPTCMEVPEPRLSGATTYVGASDEYAAFVYVREAPGEPRRRIVEAVSNDALSGRYGKCVEKQGCAAGAFVGLRGDKLIFAIPGGTCETKKCQAELGEDVVIRRRGF